jgi:hypothetical protein
MATPLKARSSASACPVATRLRAAIVPAALGLAMLGCGTSALSTSLTYEGTASLQTSDVAGAELGPIAVNVASCATVGTNEYGGEEDQLFSFLDLGAGCAIPLASAGATLIGIPGESCTLRIGAHAHALRITDALVTRGYGFVLRRSYINPAAATVRVGADEDDEQGHTRHVLLSFQGSVSSGADANAWCRETLPKFRRPKRIATQ